MASKAHFDQALTGLAHHGKKRHRPSGMESINEPKRSSVYWNVNIVKTFLDACIHEMTNNGKEGDSLTPMSWKKVGEILKDRHNFSVDSNQMKSYFNGLKNKYRAWLSLKNKTKNKYDPSTNMFNLTDKEWEKEMKENKWVQTLRNSPLPFPDLCAQLFDSDISTGIKSQGQSFGEHIPKTNIQKDTMSLASSFSDDPPFENKRILSQFSSYGLSCFRFDPWLSTNWPPGFDHVAGPSVTQANIGRGWAFLGPVRPVVPNKPTFHPLNRTAPGVDQAFTGPVRRRKNRRKPRTPTLPLPHISIRSPGDVFLKPQAVGPMIPPSAETPVGPHKGECEVAEPQKVCSSLLQVPTYLPHVQPAKPDVPPELPHVRPATALKPLETKSEEPLLPLVPNTSTFHPSDPDRTARFSIASSSSSFSFSNLVGSSSSPLVGLEFPLASSSSSTTPSPTFGFGGSGLFGSTSNSSLFGPTSTFGTSSMFGASSTSTTTSTAVTSPFSSGLLGSSSSPTPTFWSADSSPTSSFSFANVTTTSTALQSSSILKTASTTLTIPTTASKSLSFPAFGVTSSSTGAVPIFSSYATGAASIGTSTSFLGFQTSSKTVPATNRAPSSQPQSTAASSLFGMESFKELKRNKRNIHWSNVAGGLSGEASLPIPPSAPPLPTTESPQKEQMVEVPPELPHVQPATAFVAIETKQPMSVFEEEILGVLKMMADKINKPQPPSKPTFEDCEKKLNELGWPKNDLLHLVALTIFYDENDNYRELWMKLNPNLCADWVRMIGRSKRFT